MLKTIGSILTARWFWSLVGAIILSLLIWFFGDLLQIGAVRPLGTPVARLVAILVIVLLWAAWNLIAMARARRANDQFVQALAEPAAKPAPGETEVAELARRFTGALDQLKRSRLGARGSRRWLYELPWYVMIGPPGSGKTTALAQSGLRFPLGQVQDLRGVGGTRYCDWVFTDEAVLIDTAGRYTTQDSDSETDKAAWDGFLELLKKHRARQPLNGILVAISVRDLLAGRATGEDHAARIRARLEELETRLGLRLPVYLIITKTDLVSGFTTFFDDLKETDREQVWGYTFPHQAGAPDQLDMNGLRGSIKDLVARLDRRLPRRLGEEANVDRRAEVFGFPARIAELGDEIARFVERCFPPTTYERGAWLRGVYLTSGTQTGTPIDRLMAAIASSVGVPVAAPSAVTGDRSFFLTRLLKNVVFGEANLVGRDLGRERRDRLLRTGALAGLGLVAVLAIGAWSWSFIGNRNRQLALENALASWGQSATPVARQQLLPSDADYTVVLPALNQLAAIDGALEPSDPLSMRFGLSQRATAEARTDAAYRKALADLLLPRLVLTLEKDLRARLQDPDYVIEALKIYLMLGGKAPVDAQLVETWFTLDAQNRVPQRVDSVQQHVAALMSFLPTVEPRPTLDAKLLADAQAVLDRVPLPKRAYEAMVSSAEVRGLPGWKLTEHAGPNAASTLVRRSGQPLNTDVPAVYTYDGFHEVFLELLDEQARAAWAEAWVLSGRGTPDPTDAQIEELKADMLRLYYDDAVAQWDGLLRDVTLAPMPTLEKAVDATKALSGPNSPLKLLIQSIVHETSLTVPPNPSDDKGPDLAKEATKAAGKLNSKLGKLAALVNSRRTSAAPAEVPGAPVEAHFAFLKQLVEGVNGAPPALDDAISAFGEVHAQLEQAVISGGAGAGSAAALGAARQLAQAGKRLPAPLDAMVGGAAKQTESRTAGEAREKVNAAWKGDVLPFCRKAIGGRFPFAQSSGVDASIDDVVRLFGPSGMIPGFIKTQLASLVDTSRQPWRDQQGIGLSSGALAQLARADQISSALFAAGAGPKASFTLTPLTLDADSASVTLDVDGQAMQYAHGPARPSPFTWPGPGGTNIVRLTFAPVSGGAPVTVVKEGAWSLFRLLHEADFVRTDQPDVFEVTMNGGGHSARFRLRAASVENPFDLRMLSGFACPDGL